MLAENITGNLYTPDVAVCPKGKTTAQAGHHRGTAAQTEGFQCQQGMGEREREKEQKSDRRTEKKVIYNNIAGGSADKNSSFP